jgi:DNA helicase-2/ATP-dependent DNA helicase PcrA
MGGRAVFTHPEQLSQALGIPFSSEQLAAATAPLEPGVIIAGAGSGKTTVMAARVVWLVGRGLVAPEQVLGLTFTRKAAAELSDRIREALIRSGIVGADPWYDRGEQAVMTYDAFAARLVAEHGLRIGVEPGQAMLTGAGRFRLARRVVTAAAGPFDRLTRLRPDTVTDRVLGLDADLSNHLVTLEQLHDHARGYLAGLDQAPRTRTGASYKEVGQGRDVAEERLELASLATDYQQLKLDLGLVEFADQMAVAARLATGVPEVSRRLREEYRVVLLDEYQDTSAAQAALLRGLFSGQDRASGLGHPVTAVGDPFQAIYGWRGAAASNIVEFAADFPTTSGQDARRYPLTINRRSGEQVLALANDVAEGLRSDPLVAMDLSDARLVAPAEAPGAEVWAAGFADWPSEVDWVADRVVDLHEGPRAVPWSEIAVLSRRNADLGDLYGALRSRDVPVEIVGLGGLLSLPEVRDVVATLEVLDDPTANPAMIRILTGARWRIGPPDLALLGRRATELAERRAPSEETGLRSDLEAALSRVDPTDVVSLAEAVADPGDGPYSPAAVERFRRLADEFVMLRKHTDESAVDLTRRVIRTIGLDVEVALRRAGRSRDRSPMEAPNQLDRFVEAVAAYTDVDGDSSLRGLLAYLDAELSHGIGLDVEVPRSDTAVQLLTIHKAKGLEWDIVFLPDLARGVFPSERTSPNWVRNAATLPAGLRGDARSIPQLKAPTNAAMQDYKADLKEDHERAEDRLAYVGFTRARRIVAGSHHTWHPGLVNPRTPSKYFELVAEHAGEGGTVWCLAPPHEDLNPLVTTRGPVGWPSRLDEAALELRLEGAALVEAELQALTHPRPRPVEEPSLYDDALTVAEWDMQLEQLLRERKRHDGVRSVPVVRPTTRDRSSARFPTSRPPPRDSACGSTNGCSSGSARFRCSGPRSTTNRRRSPTTWRSMPCARRSKPGGSATAGRWRSRCRSRCGWDGTSCAAGSTPSSRGGPPARTSSWTGRRASGRRPIPCNCPATAWRGPGSAGYRWTRSRRGSIT